MAPPKRFSQKEDWKRLADLIRMAGVETQRIEALGDVHVSGEAVHRVRKLGDMLSRAYDLATKRSKGEGDE